MKNTDTLSRLFTRVIEHTYLSEHACVQQCLDELHDGGTDAAGVDKKACALLQTMRNRKSERSAIDAFIEEYDLSTQDGVALMCLAESLLRVPDTDTVDKLIADKLGPGKWESHLHDAQPYFIKASTYGLALSGKWLKSDLTDFEQTRTWFGSLKQKISDSTIRQAVKAAMRLMANHYIYETNIKSAIKQANATQQLCSFDMLGEGARTAADAQRYLNAYQNAIAAMAVNADKTPYMGHGISVKLSALHPRYEHTKSERLMAELYPILLELAKTAKAKNIGLNIDAEESWRLCLSMQLFEKLVSEPELATWQGLGFVLQAYNKRALAVADWLGELGRVHQRRIMVRLVKGAYWDTEIKHAQQLGLQDYPVLTVKQHSDVAYAACAKKLIHHAQWVYPQFATHNVNSLVQVYHLANGKCEYEIQRLHGMGDILFDTFLTQHPHVRARVYAPIGEYNDLLPYLVRRLLENGANSAFVHNAFNERVSCETLTPDIFSIASPKTSQLKLPKDLFKADRVPRDNAMGFDIQEPYHLAIFQTSNNAFQQPSENHTNIADVDLLFDKLHQHQYAWDSVKGTERARRLKQLSQKIEDNRAELMSLLVHEAGRTLQDALDEIREAADFCRYYATLAEQQFETPFILTSPTGETNQLSLHGRGVFVCISPWNFPLAIFVGQICAALAAGNTVAAKPAEQTPGIAGFVETLFRAAGIDQNTLHIFFGNADLAKAMLANQYVAGVAFTGSTQTAKSIQRQLADKDGPIVPLIAETGGLNAMIVDSSALLEQSVDDLIQSAFGSAGQRCSATRIAFIQDTIAEAFIQMLIGACEELQVCHPEDPACDMGPIIDANAKHRLTTYLDNLPSSAKLLYAYPETRLPDTGHFIGPHIIELSTASDLTEEVFGPILHIHKFKAENIHSVLEDIHRSGYGLTMGIHSRLDYRVNEWAKRAKVGNIYINRNTIGAVVGVNPFGGQGLSGTGPKAGGPNYLLGFAVEKTITNNISAKGGNPDLFNEIH